VLSLNTILPTGSYFWSDFAVDQHSNTLLVCATPRAVGPSSGYQVVVAAVDLASGNGTVLLPASATGFDSCMGMYVIGNPPSSNVPTVQQLAPTSGPQKSPSGATIFLSGTHFQNTPTLACLFGTAVPTAAVFHMDTVIECVLPSSPVPGQAWVQVTNDGLAYSTDPVFYEFTKP